jgi:hypothetical protein
MSLIFWLIGSRGWEIYSQVFTLLHIDLCSSSVVIDHLVENAANQGPAAYFYFDYADRLNYTTEKLLASLLSQLLVEMELDSQDELTKIENLAGGLDETRRTRNRALPGREQLLDAMQACSAQFKTVYSVLDALDECPESLRPELFQVIKTLGANAGIKFFCTTRTHLDHVTTVFPDRETEVLPIKAEASDIRNYVSFRLQGEPLSHELRNTIEATLVNGAKGS